MTTYSKTEKAGIKLLGAGILFGILSLVTWPITVIFKRPFWRTLLRVSVVSALWGQLTHLVEDHGDRYLK